MGHGCGHNLIATMSTGAAIGLAKTVGKIDGEINGQIIVLGCPAEETEGGKIIVINNDGFKDIDFAMMIIQAIGILLGEGVLLAPRLMSN
jgi:metal-dependent amidase/aminoacylase/carboxypeptidase family protein